MRTWASSAALALQIWQLSCSHSRPDAVLEAVSGAAKILASCGIALKAGEVQALPAESAWCELPPKEIERRPLLRAMTRPLRLKNLRGLSLFVLPTAPHARYAFSIVDERAGAGCGSPKDAATLAETGSIFVTDFGLASDPDFSARLIAHEIAHELTMKRHPTHAKRGYLLSDHAADMGEKVSPDERACMAQSPFVTP